MDGGRNRVRVRERDLVPESLEMEQRGIYLRAWRASRLDRDAPKVDPVLAAHLGLNR